MLTLELSSCLLEIPNDATISHSEFWYAVHNSFKSTVSWLVDLRDDNNKMAMLYFNMLTGESANDFMKFNSCLSICAFHNLCDGGPHIFRDQATISSKLKSLLLDRRLNGD